MIPTFELRTFHSGRGRFARPLRSGMPYRVDATRFLGDILKFLGSFRARARLGPAFHETAQYDRTHKAGYPCLLPGRPYVGTRRGIFKLHQWMFRAARCRPDYGPVGD